RAGEAPVDRVVLEQVGEGVRVGDVVDRHELERLLLEQHRGPQHVAPDASEPVDAHPHGHRRPPQLKSGIAARPKVTARTVRAPARSSAPAAAASVAPVVNTSSTKISGRTSAAAGRRGAGPSGAAPARRRPPAPAARTANASATFASRSAGVNAV